MSWKRSLLRDRIPAEDERSNARRKRKPVGKPAQRSKVLIYVEGGIVQSVVSTEATVEVEVFDVDNLREDPELLSGDGDSPDFEAAWKDKTKGMTEVY